jgi:hypothetical protein
MEQQEGPARFRAVLQRFGEQGEKTGWTYLEVPPEVCEPLKPGQRQSFRVKGFLGDHPIRLATLLPMGGGHFILAVNAAMRRGCGKEAADELDLCIEVDDSPLPMSEDLLACLEGEPEAQAYFLRLPPSHQRYYSNWIEEAKTLETEARRISQALCGMAMGMDFGATIRYFRGRE